MIAELEMCGGPLQSEEPQFPEDRCFSTWVRLLRANRHYNRRSGDSNHALDFDSLQLWFLDPNPNLYRFLHGLAICTLTDITRGEVVIVTSD